MPEYLQLRELVSDPFPSWKTQKQLLDDSFRSRIFQSGDPQLVTRYFLAVDAPEEEVVAIFGEDSPFHLAYLYAKVQKCGFLEQELCPVSPLPQASSKISRDYLSGSFDDQALEWCYYGLWNSSKMDFKRLAPEDAVALSAGVWLYKWLKGNGREFSLPEAPLEAVKYVLGIGKKALSSHCLGPSQFYSRTTEEKDLDSCLSSFDPELIQQFVERLAHPIRWPHRDFYVPRGRMRGRSRGASDATYRKNLLSAILSALK